MNPTPVLDTRDVCNIRCYGNAEVGGDDMEAACGEAGTRVERGSTEFERCTTKTVESFKYFR